MVLTLRTQISVVALLCFLPGQNLTLVARDFGRGDPYKVLPLEVATTVLLLLGLIFVGFMIRGLLRKPDKLLTD